MSAAGSASLAERPGAQADDALRARIHALREGLEHGLIGCTGLVERLLIGLLTGGHLLIEGAPGLAKTRAVKRLPTGSTAPSPASSAPPT